MTTIITKNSSTVGDVPLASNLAVGELAINVEDKQLFSKNAAGNVIALIADVTGNPNNVKDFGAKGDGTTDDTAAIQAVLDLQGQVYIPTGTYIISSSLRVKSNTRFYGDGVEATIIKEGGTVGTTLEAFAASLIVNDAYLSTDLTVKAAGNDSVCIENIGIHGNRAVAVPDGSATATNKGIGGVYLYNCSRSRIRDCFFQNGWSGFVIAGTRTGFSNQLQNSIFDCTVFNATSWRVDGNSGTPRGILVTSAYTYMRGCSVNQSATCFYIGGYQVVAEACNAFSWTYDNGFYCLAPELAMSNCRAHGKVTAGVGFGNGFALAYNTGAQLTNCTAKDCSNMGFRLHAPQRNTNLTNCIAINCGYGFRAENSLSFTGTTATSANEVINVAPAGLTSSVTVRMVTIVFPDNPVGSVARNTYGAAYDVAAQTLFTADGWVNMSGASVAGFNGSFPTYSISGNTIKYISEDAPVDSNYPTTNNPQASGGTPVVKYCTHDIHLSNIISDTSELDGIQMYEAGNVVINNATVRTAKRNGVGIEDSRGITVHNSMFYETYQSAIFSTNSRNVCIDNVKTYDTKGSGDSSSSRGVVSFYQTQGITVTNVVGTSYKGWWIAQSLTETIPSTGLVKDNFRTDNLTQIDQTTYPVHYEGSGAGTPEGARIAGVGSVWYRNDGGSNTALYIKESGTSSTGWVAK